MRALKLGQPRRKPERAEPFRDRDLHFAAQARGPDRRDIRRRDRALGGGDRGATRDQLRRLRRRAADRGAVGAPRSDPAELAERRA